MKLSLSAFWSKSEVLPRVSIPQFVSLLLLIALVGAGGAQAQDRQVPLDQDSTLYVLDADLRDRLGLFRNVDGFQEAALFRLSDGDFELVIQYRRGGQTLRERRSLTPQEAADLRGRIDRRMAETGTVADLNQDGRYGFIASTTALSVVEGGLLAVALDAGDQGAGTLTLLGAAGGFFIPLFATRNARVTDAEADMTFYGGTQGIVHGVQLYGLLSDNDGEGRGGAALASVLGAGEAMGAYWIARTNNWSGGHAEMTSITGLSGNLVGLGVAEVVSEDDLETRAAAGLSFAGSLVGAGVGHWLGRSGRYTQGDARIYGLAGVQGANLASSFVTAADVDNDRAAALAVTAAGVGGLALGKWMVGSRDFTETDGNLVALGSIAGALAGGGFALAADASARTAAVLQALGSAAGFGISYSVFSREANRRASTRSAVNLQLNVHPSTVSTRAPVGRRMDLADKVVPRFTLTATF